MATQRTIDRPQITVLLYFYNMQSLDVFSIFCKLTKYWHFLRVVIKEKGFTNEKLSYFESKTHLCDIFDIKLRNRFIDTVFAYHNPSARSIASPTEPVKRVLPVVSHLKAGERIVPGVHCKYRISNNCTLLHGFAPYLSSVKTLT